MAKYVKFTGKFTDLIPDGWTFQKLFARNYRQYHKTCDGEEYGQGCRIWQHLGGYLEIEDLFSNSCIIVDKIQRGEIIEWASQVSNRVYGKPDEYNTVYWLILDNEKKTAYPFHSEESKRLKRITWDAFQQLEKKEITQEQYKQITKAYYDRYREFNLDDKLVAMIQDLLNKKWIEVAEDNRPTRH